MVGSHLRTFTCPLFVLYAEAMPTKLVESAIARCMERARLARRIPHKKMHNFYAS